MGVFEVTNESLVKGKFPDAEILVEVTREKSRLYLCISRSREDLAQRTGEHIAGWLSCWCFSAEEAWSNAARKFSVSVPCSEAP